MVVIVERSFPSHPEQCLTYWNLLFQAFEEPSHDSLEKIHSHVKRRAKTRDEKEGAEKTCPVLATRLPGNNGGVSLSKLGTTNTWPCDVIWKESFRNGDVRWASVVMTSRWCSFYTLAIFNIITMSWNKRTFSDKQTSEDTNSSNFYCDVNMYIQRCTSCKAVYAGLFN